MLWCGYLQECRAGRRQFADRSVVIATLHVRGAKYKADRLYLAALYVVVLQV